MKIATNIQVAQSLGGNGTSFSIIVYADGTQKIDFRRFTVCSVDGIIR